ncbi:MAG: hypothetical protein ACRDYY_15245 [Acidimicrobiales bacterium]
MKIRFFVDENDIALGKALAATNPEVVYPGHPDLPDIPRGSLDDEWLPTVGRKGLVVITRDKRIRYRKVEKARWVTSGVRGFVLTGKRSQATQDSRVLLERWWTTIEKTVEGRPLGPWMYSVTQDRLREIDL